MGSRNTEKNMLKQHGYFETCCVMIERALASAKTKPKKLKDLQVELKSYYYEFDAAFRVYKADVIGKDCTSAVEFNGKKEDGSDSFAYNDNWAKLQMDKFCEITEKIEDKLEELELCEVKDS